MNTTLYTPPDLMIWFTDVFLKDSEHVHACELLYSIKDIVLVIKFAGFE
jgi:hypothetical protein